MALQVTEILFQDFPSLSVGIFRPACFALSCRNGTRRSLPRRCIGRVACGVGDMMERAVPSYLFNAAIRALRGRCACGCTVLLGNMRCTVRPDKSCPVPRGSRAHLNHSHLMRVGEGASSGRLAPMRGPGPHERSRTHLRESGWHVEVPDPPAGVRVRGHRC